MRKNLEQLARQKAFLASHIKKVCINYGAMAKMTAALDILAQSYKLDRLKRPVDEIEDLKLNLGVESSRVTILQAKNTELYKENQELGTKASQLDTKSQGLKAEVEELKKGRSALEEEIAALKQEKSNLQKALEEEEKRSAELLSPAEVEAARQAALKTFKEGPLLDLMNRRFMDLIQCGYTL